MIKWLEALGINILAIFAPIESVILTSLLLLVVDLITGIMAAKKRGEPITSAGLRRTVSKIFIYEAALLLAFLTEKYLLGHMMPVTKMVSGMIGMVELKSVFENMNDISGQDLLSSLLTKLNSDNSKKLDNLKK